MNAPDKTALKETLLELERVAKKEAEAASAAFLAEATPEAGEVVDEDVLAQTNIQLTQQRRAEEQVHEHQEHAAAVEALNLSPRTTVGPGAVVKLGGRDRWLFVSVATPALVCAGQPVLGISPDSPLAMAMDGLEVGDAFDVNGREWTIEYVG